jgi:hypothetical protein
LNRCSPTGTYQLGDFVRYRVDNQIVVGRLRGIASRERRHVAKVEQLVTYSFVPGHLRSMKRDNGEMTSCFSTTINST